MPLARCDLTASNGARFAIELSDCERYWLTEITTPSGRRKYRVYSGIDEAIGAGLVWTRYQRPNDHPTGDETNGCD